MSKSYISDTVYWIKSEEYDSTYQKLDNLIDARVYLSDCVPYIISMLHSKPFGIGLVDREFYEIAGHGIGGEFDCIERYNSLSEVENRILYLLD